MIFDGICIDEFSCRYVFLTHWHQDHVKGLNNKFKGTIFASEITCRMVKKTFPKVNVVIVHSAITFFGKQAGCRDGREPPSRVHHVVLRVVGCFLYWRL